VKKKRVVDRTVAMLLGLRERYVSGITQAFLHEVLRAIVEDGGVHLDGFGRFRLVRDNYPPRPIQLRKGTFRKGEVGEMSTVIVRKKYRVYFSKAEPFKNAIRDKYGSQEEPMPNDDNEMTKLGVDEGMDQTQLEKAASNGCPECGGRLTRHGRTVICENCGSRPFEGKK
jgi:nucleoid DNA-binding protein